MSLGCEHSFVFIASRNKSKKCWLVFSNNSPYHYAPDCFGLDFISAHSFLAPASLCSSPFVVHTRRMIIYTAIAAIVFLLIAAAFLAADVSAGLLVSPLTWFFQLMNMAIDLRPPILPMALAASSVAWMSRLRAKGWLTVGPRCGDGASTFIHFSC